MGLFGITPRCSHSFGWGCYKGKYIIYFYCPLAPEVSMDKTWQNPGALASFEMLRAAAATAQNAQKCSKELICCPEWGGTCSRMATRRGKPIERSATLRAFPEIEACNFDIRCCDTVVEIQGFCAGLDCEYAGAGCAKVAGRPVWGVRTQLAVSGYWTSVSFLVCQ